MYQLTVCDHRMFRPLSPRGVMLLSIERPQGDQLARSAAMVASAHPAASNHKVAVNGDKVTPPDGLIRLRLGSDRDSGVPGKCPLP